jgi:hypothetical protein
MNEEKKPGEKKEAPKPGNDREKAYRFKAACDCIYQGGYVSAGTVIAIAEDKAPPHFAPAEAG